MINIQSLESLNSVEGDFLFIIESTLAPVTKIVNNILDKSIAPRVCHFVCTDTSSQYGKSMDLSNRLKNLGLNSTLYKGSTSNYLTNLPFKKLSLLYVEESELNNTQQTFFNLHDSLSKNAQVIYNGLDISNISTYINDNKLSTPLHLTGGGFRWPNNNTVIDFKTAIIRSKSDKF